MQIGENTARRRFGRVREIFNAALEEGLIRRDPFKLRSIKVSVGVGKKEYIEAERILPYFPSAEWRLLLTFGRFAGLRMPSEIQSLRWPDIDWERRTIRVRSPKTQHIGKGERTIPIFPELAPYLDARWEELKEGSGELVFASMRRHSNTSTTAKKFVERAGETAWPAFWNSLRASCETDLMDRYGIRRACQWIGNTVSIAMKNYAQIKKTDFADLGGKAPLQSDAKSDAEGARKGKIRRESPRKTRKKRAFGGT